MKYQNHWNKYNVSEIFWKRQKSLKEISPIILRHTKSLKEIKHSRFPLEDVKVIKIIIMSQNYLGGYKNDWNKQNILQSF